MNVFVDTSVWSLAYRRSEADLNAFEKRVRSEVAELIRETRARVIGPICGELLSGIRDRNKFEEIWRDFSVFYEEPLTLWDYRRGAELSNQLRAKGITGHLVDCLLCAVAIDRGYSVFTTDEDFRRYSKYIPLRLHAPRA
jgi:predicted nucleic acid-binding protein